jgi:hypothetical protein
MPHLETSIPELAQRAVDEIIDSIAINGIKVLKQILEDEGFSKNEYLKDHEVLAHVYGKEIWFEILLDMESIDDNSKQDLTESSDEEEPPSGARTFGFSDPKQISRLISSHEGRRDARKQTRDARRDARQESKHLQSIYKTSQIRAVQHKLAAHTPRSIRVDPRSGRVSLRLKSMIQERTEEDAKVKFVYKQNKFEGIVGKFMNKLVNIISGKFSDELQKIILRYIS